MVELRMTKLNPPMLQIMFKLLLMIRREELLIPNTEHVTMRNADEMIRIAKLG